MLALRQPSVAVPAVVLGVLIGLAGCASESKSASGAVAQKQTPTHAQLFNEVNATVHVVALDKATRLVTLREEDGRMVEIRAGDELRNFDQIVVGDALKVHYRQSLAATLLPPGSDPNQSQGGLVAARAEPGAKPGGSVGAHVSVRVKIISVDAAREVVVFSMSSGELVAHQIATPEGREFIKGLKVGDVVQLDYSEALALSIEPVKAAG